jgi:hypothetical protein
MKFILAALALFSPSLALAAEAPAAAAPVTIAKAKFVEGFKAGFPDVICAEKAYFRKCFEVTQDACKKAASAALATCLTEIEKDIPAQLKQPADGQNWGEKLGTCTGSRYEAEQPKAKAASPDCSDPNKWK